MLWVGGPGKHVHAQEVGLSDFRIVVAISFDEDSLTRFEIKNVSIGQ
jgi:hypothetical protein